MKAQHEGTLTSPCIVWKNPPIPLTLVSIHRGEGMCPSLRGRKVVCSGGHVGFMVNRLSRAVAVLLKASFSVGNGSLG